MDVEVTNITQLTDSVQLTEPRNLVSLQLENDSDAEMDLNGDGDPSRDIRVSGIPKWDQDEIGTHTTTTTRIVGDTGSCPDSEYEAHATGDGRTVLASRIPLLPTALASNSRDIPHVIFEGMESHEDDDPDDSEWLDSASVRADTQSIIGGDSEEDEYSGETGEDDNEIPSGDEVVPSLRDVPNSDSDVVKE